MKVEPTRLRQITLGGGVEIDEIKTDVHLLGGWEDHNFLGGLRDFSVTFKPGVVLYPLRIDNLGARCSRLLEERLQTSAPAARLPRGAHERLRPAASSTSSRSSSR